MNIVTPTVGDILYIAGRLREDEIAQYLALTGLSHFDPDSFTRTILRVMGEVSFCALDADGLPYCAGGFDEVRPKVWQSWMIGTPDGWENHWRDITKISRRMMDNLLASDRANRIQDYSMPTRTAAHEWYKRGLKMEFEGTIRKLYADGQDAVCYVKVKE